MANELTLTVEGNLTADPEKRTTNTGRTVTSFTIAHTDRKYDRTTGEWTDAGTVFMRCTAWGNLGDAAAEQLTKGMSVIAGGTLRDNAWTDAKTGQNRHSLEMTVSSIGVSVRSRKPQSGTLPPAQRDSFGNPYQAQPTTPTAPAAAHTAPAAAQQQFGGEPWAAAMPEPEF